MEWSRVLDLCITTVDLNTQYILPAFHQYVSCGTGTGAILDASNADALALFLMEAETLQSMQQQDDFL